MGRNNHPLIEASEKALKEALKVIKPGVKICEVSEVVEDTINNFGFNPIHNLCGHGLERYNQHAHPSIPNGKNNIKEELKSGVIAMEVFATNGTGMVKESRPILIYQYMNDVPVRMSDARKILERSKKDFNGLPFTKRWMGDITPVRMDMALKQLVDVGGLREFALLKEETKGLVAQTEETIII